MYYFLIFLHTSKQQFLSNVRLGVPKMFIAEIFYLFRNQPDRDHAPKFEIRLKITTKTMCLD